MKEDNDNMYKTTDFYLSAFLIARGYECSVEKGKRSDFNFCFEKNDQLKEDKEAYFSQGLVGALAFKNAIRDLKSRMKNYEYE